MSSVTPSTSTAALSALLNGLNSPALNDTTVNSANALDNINGTGAGGDGTNSAALAQQTLAAAQDNANAGVGAAYYDGTNYTSAVPTSLRPSNFNVAVTDDDAADDFLSWSSQTQIDYLQNNPSAFASGTYAVGAEATIGSGANVIHVMVSNASLSVIELDNLQKTDIMKMSLQDQDDVVNSPFWSTLSSQLNLYASSTSQASTALSSIQTEITTVQNAATAADDNVNGMTAADKQPFLDELNLLYQQASKFPVVSPTDIANALQLIDQRFQRANDFAQQKFVTNDPSYTNLVDSQYSGLVETDQSSVSTGSANPQILSGYRNFIQQETQIASAGKAAANLAASPVLNNKSLDLPNLVYFFELYATLIGEAMINADTAEVQQLNDLLNTYSNMQNIINTTIQDFSSTDQTTKQGLLGTNDKGNFSSFSEADKRTIAMFEDAFSGSAVGGTVEHPLEKLYGISRPTMDFIQNTNGNTNTYLKDSWNSFNTSLSNTVSQLNQQSQLKMNNINDETKQKDREFDLGNNVLSKMADMIQSIGRNVS